MGQHLEALEALRDSPTEGLVSISHYRPGDLVRCQLCVERRRQGAKVSPDVIIGVPLGSRAIARTISSDADAVPGSGTYRCSTCRTWTQVEFLKVEAAA